MHARVAPILVLAATATLAPAGDVYVWKVKGSNKAVQANEVSPPTFELSLLPRDKDKPSYDLIPGPGLFTPFQIAYDPFQSDEFTAWFQEASRGKNIRKTISVGLLQGSRPIYRFEAEDAELTGFAFPAYRPGRMANFAVGLEGQATKVKTQNNPLYSGGGREVVNPLFGVRVQMGDGSVRPVATSPIVFGVSKDKEDRPMISVKPIRLELKRTAAEPYRKWLADIQSAVDSGADASASARPLSLQYLTRKGVYTVKLGKTFVQSVVLLGDGSVRVTVGTDVTGEITLEAGRE